MADTLTRYDQSFLTCRTFGHAWDVTYTTEREGRPFFGVVLSCMRCRMERVDGVTRGTGEVGSRRYTRPDNYLIPGRLARTAARLEWLRRARRSTP